MYKIALMKGYEYQTNRGVVSTQDLFNIPLRSGDGFNLNEIAKTINSQISQSEKESFVDVSPKETIHADKLEVVKDVISCKLNIESLLEKEASNRIRREKLLQAIASKEDSENDSKTKEELIEELSLLDS